MSIRHVGVVGAGTMGKGITHMLAEQGIDVWLIARSTREIDQAKATIESLLDKEIEKWAITEGEKKVILSRIQYTTDLEVLREAELVIESIDEELAAKKGLFDRLDRICSMETIFATNTSTLSLTELASHTLKPDRLIGVHFVHPVARAQVVEIVRGLKTSDDTFRTTKAFIEQSLEKVGVEVFESPGYVTTRVIMPMINEAIQTLMEGVATPKDLDLAMKLGFDFGAGPLEMADRMGLDTVLHLLERLFHEHGDTKYRPSPLLKKMVRAGHLGEKTGEGFFRYDMDGDRLDTIRMEEGVLV
jgi:3-hydroxybutyryl-CoA dehydrogenase